MVMIVINDQIRLDDGELTWSFVRSGGPGGQNVNKVASKAVLRWDLNSNVTLPEEVKLRLRAQQRNRITNEGDLVLSSQRFRDQDRNRQDCVEKLRAVLLQALHQPEVRRPTKPTRGAHRARLRQKKHRAQVKTGRRKPELE
jgi:ribosome-associated protein